MGGVGDIGIVDIVGEPAPPLGVPPPAGLPALGVPPPLGIAPPAGVPAPALPVGAMQPSGATRHVPVNAHTTRVFALIDI
jgi:hypothetical protein